MKLIKSDSRVVFVVSDGGGGCPRAIINTGKIKLRDDYHNRLNTKNKFVRKFFTL
jgi:hypothetical protein